MTRANAVPRKAPATPWLRLDPEHIWRDAGSGPRWICDFFIQRRVSGIAPSDRIRIVATKRPSRHTFKCDMERDWCAICDGWYYECYFQMECFLLRANRAGYRYFYFEVQQ